MPERHLPQIAVLLNFALPRDCMTYIAHSFYGLRAPAPRPFGSPMLSEVSKQVVVVFPQLRKTKLAYEKRSAADVFVFVRGGSRNGHSFVSHQRQRVSSRRPNLEKGICLKEKESKGKQVQPWSGSVLIVQDSQACMAACLPWTPRPGRTSGSSMPSLTAACCE